MSIDWDQYNAWELHWDSKEIWVQAILLVMVPLALWFFSTSLNRIKRWPRKIFLFSLRVVTFLLVLLVLFQPQLELKKIQPVKNSIAVLLDNSKSMSIRTFPADRPRREVVMTALERNREFLDRLKRDYAVDFYVFSDTIERVPERELVVRYTARGVNTDLSRVFQELRKEYEDKSLQGVILISDGVDLIQEPGKMSREFSETLSRLAGPVHALQAGTNLNFKDLSIEQLEVNDFGFIGQPLKLRVRIVASGLGSKNIPLVLKEGEKILVSKSVEIDDQTPVGEVEMEFTPLVQGKHIYSLSVPLFAGESVDTNNRWDFEVKVIRDRIRVLHLNGKPSWDSRFLRETLTNNPKVDLLSFFILRTLSDDVEASTDELSLIPFPSNLLFTDYLNSFDLVIFHNFRFSPFVDKRYLNNIKEYVEKGGGFLMIGGDLSFQEGAYMRTAVEDILPVRFARNSERFLFDNFKMEIKPRLSHHPILRLEKEDARNQKAWRSLPELNGMNIGLRPVADAQTLGVYSPRRKGREHPVIATRKVGEGRTMILATDTSWNWNFLSVGKGGSGRHYQKFWENVLAWMVGDPETRPAQVTTDKEKYRETDRVLIHFRMQGEDYNPLPGKPVELVVSRLPSGAEVVRKVLETDENGEGRFEMNPGQEGFYSVKVSAQGKAPGVSAETRFSVTSPKVEFQKPRVNSALMKSIASVTGGTYRVLDRDPDLSDLQFPNPEVAIKTNTRFVSLWDSWWSYGLILGFLTLEWWARRKSGLS